MKTYSFEDGKYEIDRDENGLMTAARRYGESWPQVFEALRFMQVFHAALNAIDANEADATRFRKLNALVQSMPANEGAFYFRRLNDGSINIRRVCLPEIEDSTYGATLAEAIDAQPDPK